MIVDATTQHMEQYYGGMQKCSCRALAILDDEGKVIGLCGYYHAGGRYVVFTEISEALRRSPKTMLKAGWKLVELLKQSRLPIVAFPDKKISASVRFAEHFGFRQQHNGVLQWPT